MSSMLILYSFDMSKTEIILVELSILEEMR